MTLKIETASDGQVALLRLIGRLESQHIDELRAHIRGHQGVAFDLEEVTLVCVEVVRFLAECEAAGVELRHCPLFIREWMGREERGDA